MYPKGLQKLHRANKFSLQCNPEKKGYDPYRESSRNLFKQYHKQLYLKKIDK